LSRSGRLDFDAEAAAGEGIVDGAMERFIIANFEDVSSAAGRSVPSC